MITSFSEHHSNLIKALLSALFSTRILCRGIYKLCKSHFVVHFIISPCFSKDAKNQPGDRKGTAFHLFDTRQCSK